MTNKYYTNSDRRIKALFKKLGYSQDCKSTKAYNYHSGHFRKGETVIYYSTGDYRWDANSLLIRHALHNKDYTGGSNNTVTNDEATFENEFNSMVTRLEKQAPDWRARVEAANAKREAEQAAWAAGADERARIAAEKRKAQLEVRIKETPELEDIKNLMDASYSLEWVDYRDNLDDTDDTFALQVDYMTGGYILQDNAHDWFMDGRDDSEKEAFKQTREALFEKYYLTEDEADEIMEGNRDEIQDEIQMRNDSTPVKDLINNSNELNAYISFDFNTGDYYDDVLGGALGAVELIKRFKLMEQVPESTVKYLESLDKENFQKQEDEETEDKIYKLMEDYKEVMSVIQHGDEIAIGFRFDPQEIREAIITEGKEAERVELKIKGALIGVGAWSDEETQGRFNYTLEADVKDLKNMLVEREEADGELTIKKIK